MKLLQKLETPRLVIRRLHKNDKKAFTSLMTNPVITDNLALDSSMKTYEGALTVLDNTIKSYDKKNPLLAFAIELKLDISFIGICGISMFDEHSVEVFYALLPGFWGKGLATETLNLLKRHLLDDKKIIHAYIRPSNIASIRVAEKAGFVRKSLVTKEYFVEQVYDYEFHYYR
jgi:ribosomal-protein-alanine N-acetyltransferase